MYRPTSRHFGVALVASACALICAQSAGAATVRVDPSGSIDAALEHAQPGDTILVETGTYAALVEASPLGTADAPITLKPAPGAHPVVSAGFKLIHARHVRVTDMTFDGTGNPAGFGTSIWDGHHITYARNEITGYGAWAQGVLVKEKSTGVRIVGNHIHHMGARDRFDHGIYCESATGTADRRQHDRRQRDERDHDRRQRGSRDGGRHAGGPQRHRRSHEGGLERVRLRGHAVQGGPRQRHPRQRLLAQQGAQERRLRRLQGVRQRRAQPGVRRRLTWQLRDAQGQPGARGARR
jgi:hypothetical protein